MNWKKNYSLYSNFIKNYFIKNKKDFFKKGDYNYSIIPDDCRSNSFLENYNKYLKQRLGKKRIINWFNFISFIKEESKRSLDKLSINDNFNINYKLKKMKFKNKFYNDKNPTDDIIDLSDDITSNIKNDNNEKIDIISKENNIYQDNKINIEPNNELIINKDSNKFVGISNIKFNCYMNSALQILFHLDKFITNLLNIENISKKKFSNDLLKIYNKIIEQDNYKYISISNFMNIFVNKYNNFRVAQNDSVEFIRILLSEINNENVKTVL